MLPKTTCFVSQPYLLHYTVKTCTSLNFNAQLGFVVAMGHLAWPALCQWRWLVLEENIIILTEKYNSPSEF